MSRDNDTKVGQRLTGPSPHYSNLPHFKQEPAPNKFTGCERELRNLLEFRTDKDDFRVMVGESESDHYCAHISIQALRGGDHFQQAEHCIDFLLLEGYKIIRWPQKLSEKEKTQSLFQTAFEATV